MKKIYKNTSFLLKYKINLLIETLTVKRITLLICVRGKPYLTVFLLRLFRGRTGT